MSFLELSQDIVDYCGYKNSFVMKEIIEFYAFLVIIIVVYIVLSDLNYLHCWKWHHFSSLVWQRIQGVDIKVHLSLLEDSSESFV